MSLAGDARSSAYLEALFPGTATDAPPVRAPRRTQQDTRWFLAVPSPLGARMFLPSEPRLGAVSLRRSRRTLTRRSQWETVAAAAALRSGGGRLLRAQLAARRSGADVEALLAGIFGRPVRVSVFLGPARANRKPVLQVMGEDGALLGIAKVAVNELTDRLVRHEARWLSRLEGCDLGVVEVPRVRATTQFGEFTLVVQTPLAIPTDYAPPPPDELRRGLAAIAHSGDPNESPSGASDYIQRLRGRLSPLREGSRSLAETALASVAPTSVALGAWHGDLSPWNLAWTGQRLLVWDWERAETGVPLGMDALHYWFMPRLKSGTAEELAGVDLLSAAPAVLKAWGVGAVAARAVSLLYLLDVATRFAGDGQAQTGVRAGDVDTWLFPALQEWHRTQRGGHG